MCVVGNQSSERNKLRLDGIYQTRIFPFQFLFPGKQDQLRLLKEKKQKTKLNKKQHWLPIATDDISRDNKRLAAAAVDWKRTSDPSCPGTDYKGNAINNKDELIHHRNYRQFNSGNSSPYNTRPNIINIGNYDKYSQVPSLDHLTIGPGQTVGFIGLALAGWRAADGRTIQTDWRFFGGVATAGRVGQQTDDHQLDGLLTLLLLPGIAVRILGRFFPRREFWIR